MFLAHVIKRCMSSVSSRKIEVNNVALHCDITGTGSHTVLLLPGALGCSQTDFKMQLEHFNKELFTLVAWDPRGYGKSIPPARDWPEHFFRRDANDAVALMENLGVKKYSLLGFSDGGITSLIMAAGWPDRVNSLVTWGANAFVTQEDVELYEKIRNIDNWSEAMRKPYMEVYGEEYFRIQFSLWVDAISSFINRFNGDICRDDAKAVSCPTLILHGSEDPLVPRFHPEFLLRNIKNSRQAVVFVCFSAVFKLLVVSVVMF